MNTISCTVHGFRSRKQTIQFESGKDLKLIARGPIGPSGLHSVAEDFLDLAVTIFQIEQQLSGFKKSNRPARFDLSMPVRTIHVWQQEAVKSLLEEILLLLGSATWDIRFTHDGDLHSYECSQEEDPTWTPEQVMLFSGGLDSTCGLAIVTKSGKPTLPISFYTRQMTLQRTIANSLGAHHPVQFTRRSMLKKGRGRSFYYRSFFFLAIAAVVAESWRVNRILQHENGVLALSVPPAEAWRITRHAHPSLHEKWSQLLGLLFGGDWEVVNPAQLWTKRRLYEEACHTFANSADFEDLVQKTETCWYHYSPTIPGDHRKKPNKACGVCIPCIIRRTALQDNNYAYDLRDYSVRNDEDLGLSFRSYYGFVRELVGENGSPSSFYMMLPTDTRQIVGEDGSLQLSEVLDMYKTFAEEFQETFET